MTLNIPHLYVSQEELQQIAELTNMSTIEVEKTFGLHPYPKTWSETSETQKIIDRINRRINGEYVPPAWVEALRKK